MIKFLKNLFDRKQEASPKKSELTWVGTHECLWKVDDSGATFSLFYILFVDDDDNRHIEYRGYKTEYAEHHKSYVAIAIPWLGGAPLDKFYGMLHDYNQDYWESAGFSFNDSVHEVHQPKQKKKKVVLENDGNIIQFPIK